MNPFLTQATRVAEEASNSLQLAEQRKSDFVAFLKKYGADMPDSFLATWHGDRACVHCNAGGNDLSEDQMNAAIRFAAMTFGAGDWVSSVDERRLSKTVEGVEIAIHRPAKQAQRVVTLAA